ncbi:MAG TPA: pitrilysin family protein [bacterium]|nr:pitrilysin family protein [bacterium]HPN45331.1 pitrilysin family protein [bacterium]
MTVFNTSNINININKSVLDNGIRIITERMPHIRSVSIGAWIAVGSGNETPDNNGISHFLEHMLFKGTKKRTAKEIAQNLESLGGGLNASTGKELSLYHAHVLDEHVEIAVDVLTDILQNSKLSGRELELEKNVILAEINHAKEDPEEFLLDHFYRNLFHQHPLGYFIYGTPENVGAFQRKDLKDYLDSQYLPERTVFAAAGNIEHQRFVDLVTKFYDQKKQTPSSQTSPVQSMQKIDFSRMEMDSIQQGHICMGVQTFGFTDERKYTLVLLDLLLGGGMSSRLFQNIREKYGFAYNVYSFSDIMANTGVFGVYLACADDKVKKSLQLVKNEFDRLKNEPVTDAELSLVKSQVRGNIILGLESSSRRMRKIGENEIYSGRHNSLETVLEKINQITPTDIMRLANELFQESSFCTTLLTPGKK